MTVHPWPTDPPGWVDDGPDAHGDGPAASAGYAADELEDMADVAAEGQHLADTGIKYLVDGIVPAYGMVGLLVAYAKVGKTTLAQQLAAHVATGQSFLDRATAAAKVLVLAAEDPPEYTAWMARHLHVPHGRLLVRRLPLRLTDSELGRICTTIADHQFGLVLISSWQAVVRGLLRDENDNAGAVALMEQVKVDGARRSGVPWLIDAHAGKGEDQSDDADPAHALRGASSAAGAADYLLSLRYGNGTFGTQRRLSGKGRFVNFAPILLDFDVASSTFGVVGNSGSAAMAATTWTLICEMGALTATPQTAAMIAKGAGIWDGKKGTRMTAARQVAAALKDRAGVTMTKATSGHKTTVKYAVTEGDAQPCSGMGSEHGCSDAQGAL